MSAAAREHSTEADRASHQASAVHEVAPAQAAPDALPGGAHAQRGGNAARNPRRTQRDANSQLAPAAAGAEGAQGAEGAEGVQGVEGAQGAEGEAQQAPLPAPPSYHPVNPPVEKAPEPDPAQIEQAKVEKQENAALVEAQVNQAPEGVQDAPVEAPVEEVVEAPPADPVEAAAVSADPEAAAAETARTSADAQAATLAETGPKAQGAAASAGPLNAASAEEMFSAYVTAPPSQKATAHAGFAEGVGALVNSEHAAFEGEIPQLHATMNGEADVEAASAAMNLGEGNMVNEAGTRATVEVTDTPPATAFQDNEPVVDNIFSFLMKLLAQALSGDGGRGGILDSLGNIRVSDRGANKNTGPAPAVPLSGDTDTKRVADQQRQAGEQTAEAHKQARQCLDQSPGPEVITPMTMDEAFTVPTLNAPTVAPLPADLGIEYFLAHDFTPEHAAAFDGHYGPEMEANLAQAQSQVDAAVSDRDGGRTTAIQDARAEHALLTGEAQQAQAQEVLNNRQLVTTHRQETHRLQDEAVVQTRGKLETERKATMGEINKTVTAEQKKVDDHFAQAEAKAQVEVDKGDERASAERAAAEKEADDKSWWEKASDFVSSCFEALKSVINGIFDAVRAVVNTIIDAAKTFAKTIIDKACQAICGLIDTFAELAKLVVKGLLSEVFPEFTKSFCTFVEEKRAQAKQAVQVVADTLKAGVEALCDALKEGLNAILDAYQSAINAAIDTVKALAAGDWAELARKLIIAGAKVFGLNPDEILAMLDKAGESITRIIDDPMGFVSNVLGAMNKGFGQFGTNFLVHLTNGFVQWLTGPIPGIKIPENIFSVEGAFDLAMQVLGLTPEQLKIKAARHIGEDNVELIEQVWDHVQILIQGGISGLWEHVKGELADMQDAVVGAIMSYVQEKVVHEAVMFIAGLFSPLPGIPKVIKVVWDTYCWLRDNMQRIYAVVDTVVNTMHDLATGNIQPAANGIEQALAGMVPVAIDLLAGVLGLGDLPQKLQGIIHALQARVDGAIDLAIEKFKGMFRGSERQETGAAPPKPIGNGNIGEEVRFAAAGEQHRLWIEMHGQEAVTMVASTPQPVEGALAAMSTRLQSLPEATQHEARPVLASARARLAAVERGADEVAKPRGAQKPAVGADARVVGDERSLAQDMKDLFTLIGSEDAVSKYAAGPASSDWQQRRIGSVAAERINADDVGHHYHLLNDGRVVVTTLPHFVDHETTRARMLEVVGEEKSEAIRLYMERGERRALARNA